MSNPVGMRGYKKDLILKYINDRTFSITSGECHFVENPDDFDDIILKVEHPIIVSIVLVTPWEYHYIYIRKDKTVFYDIINPEFNYDKVGYYHPTISGRCIGAFFVGDGYIFEFEQIKAENHNFGKNDIYKFTRMDIICPLDDLSLDRIVSFGRINLGWSSSWEKYIFKHPNWGSLDKNCNNYTEILINILTTQLYDTNIYYRPCKSNIDKLKNNELEETYICSIITDNTTYFPNKYWKYISPPKQYQNKISVNESGEVEFKSDSINMNYFELSTIGYYLPDYISDHSGILLNKYIDIHDGFLLELKSNNNIKITSGKTSFKYPWGLSVLLNDIWLSTDHLEISSLYFIYIICSSETSILTLDSFYVSIDKPIQDGLSFYRYNIIDNVNYPYNHKCIGSFRTDNYHNISYVFDIKEGLDPSFCGYGVLQELITILNDSYSVLMNYRIPPYIGYWFTNYLVNNKVKYINDTVLDHTTWSLRKEDYDSFLYYTSREILKYNKRDPHDVTYPWEKLDPTKYHFSENHLLFRREHDKILDRKSLFLYELYDNQYLRFIDSGETELELILDSWELCKIPTTAHVYLLAHPYSDDFYRPVICDYSVGMFECESKVFKNDDIFLEYFNIDSYDELLDIDQTFAVKTIKDYGLKCARILKHDINSFLNIENINYNIIPNLNITLDVHSIIKKQIEYKNIQYDIIRNLRISDREQKHFRLLEDDCIPRDILEFKKIPIDNNLLVLFDSCIDLISCFDSSSYIFSSDGLIDRYYLLDNWNIPEEVYDDSYEIKSNYDVELPFIIDLASFNKYSFCNCLTMGTYDDILFNFVYKLRKNDYIQLRDFNFYHNILFNDFKYNLNVPKIMESLEYLRHSHLVYDLDLSYIYQEALLDLNFNKPSKTLVIFTNSDIDQTDSDLYSIINLANAINVSIFCISFDYNPQLEFLSKGTFGKYYYGSHKSIFSNLKQLRSDIIEYYYNLTFKPYHEDGEYHDLLVKVVGEYYDEKKVSFKSQYTIPDCDINNL